MSDLRLSVVVVSAGRPDALKRCLLGLSQQIKAGCEVIVVADPEGQAAARSLPVAGALKLLPQRTPNISTARNAGIAAAAGDIIAFIDDDAVPEPTWSQAILDTFGGSDLAAVTGPVLGRNGISLQWGSLAVNGLAEDVPTGPDTPVRDGFARKLQGTNMAITRDALGQVGGFDEALHFYLDDTDMSLRIAHSGLRTAWVARAVVHHGFEASTRRTAERVPLSLFDIGASSAVYLRKHAPDPQISDALRALEADQSTRLLRLARSRKLDAHQMRVLLTTLRDGIEEGMARDSAEPTLDPVASEFDPFIRQDPAPHRMLIGRWFNLKSLRKEAASLVAEGHPVSLFALEPTPRKHRVRFTDGGWWEQTGGLFGPSDRSGPRLQLSSFRSRVANEVRRISATRGLAGRNDRK
ncbi:glycosyltransferase family 2 protein [Gymnodinialimonas ceratoperidinii]|uniref:Glycosyltransferase n=1 Tax=Gymnodinialimonas ceratoperidinii TaxID=2856823 RepID=A0A8F6TX24_9RHOB|nr:glycosyltransferase [Gymnodinialimonas ceratoperidinii]QXT40018.1 glycosyltransferase [Gymnodinialimonas ceratoperidinii]